MLNNYSPNMLKTFDECQKKFYFKYIEKKALPQRAQIFEKGKKIHALASYILNGKNIEKMEQTLNADEKLTWESLKANKYFQLEPVETEYSLTCKVDKYWVGGRLDALMCDKSLTPYPTSQSKDTQSFDFGRVARGEGSALHASPLTLHCFILDYKTGQIPQNAELDFQTMVYLLCADKFLNKKGGYVSLKFVYIGLGKTPHPNPPPQGGREQSVNSLLEPQVLNPTQLVSGTPSPLEGEGWGGGIKVITFTPEQKAQYEDRIIKTCKEIDFAISSNVFKKSKTSKNCKMCEYNKLCKGGKC